MYMILGYVAFLREGASDTHRNQVIVQIIRRVEYELSHYTPSYRYSHICSETLHLILRIIKRLEEEFFAEYHEGLCSSDYWSNTVDINAKVKDKFIK